MVDLERSTQLTSGPEIRDVAANRDQYEPKPGLHFKSTDTAAEFIGDGERWNKIETTGANPSFRSLDTESLGNVRYASAFGGAVGDDKIRNAVDDLPPEGGHVIVGPEGPDDVTASSGADSLRGSKAWEITEPVRNISDHTTILFDNCYVFATDGLNDLCFENEKANDGTTDRNKNISFVGVGNAELDHNTSNQDLGSIADRFKTPLHPHKVDDLTIEGLTITEARFSLIPEDITDLTVRNIHFNQVSTNASGDGFHPVGPITRFTVNGLTGKTHDDAISLNATDEGGKGPTQGHGDGGHVIGGDISGCDLIQGDSGQFVRFAASSSYRVYDISISNSTYDCADSGLGECFMIGGGDSWSNSNRVKGISINGVGVRNCNQYIVTMGSNFPSENWTITGYSSGQSINQFIDLQGSDLYELSLNGCSIELGNPNNEPIFALKGATISEWDVNLTARGSDSEYLIDIDTNSTARNVSISGKLVNVGYPTVASGATVEKVSFDLGMRSPPDNWDINSQDVYGNGTEFFAAVGDTGKRAIAGGRAVDALITVVDTTNGTAEQFLLHGSNNSVTQLGAKSGYSTTENNDTTINVYWDGTNARYEINNESGGTITPEIVYNEPPVA